MAEEQEKKKKLLPKVVEKVVVEYNVYNCAMCTFLNDPPSAKCQICDAEAPASAIKVDLEAEKKKKEEALKEK